MLDSQTIIPKNYSKELSKEKISSCPRRYDTCANEYRACGKYYDRCWWSCSDDGRKNSSIVTDSSTVTDPPALTKCYIACKDKCRSENKECVEYNRACKDGKFYIYICIKLLTVCSKEYYYCLKDK
uniref:SJCHGC06836 protein n=1 Tax=Schistosoma japonicum TaxID=6182 RepID=Q5DE08_SCHJA|nr:SJCHGC06836 protein [Schistosoma japonicum]